MHKQVKEEIPLEYSAMLAELSEVEKRMRALQARIADKYPKLVPRCGYCESPFCGDLYGGWHCKSCGGT